MNCLFSFVLMCDWLWMLTEWSVSHIQFQFILFLLLSFSPVSCKTHFGEFHFTAGFIFLWKCRLEKNIAVVAFRTVRLFYIWQHHFSQKIFSDRRKKTTHTLSLKQEKKDKNKAWLFFPVFQFKLSITWYASTNSPFIAGFFHVSVILVVWGDDVDSPVGTTETEWWLKLKKGCTSVSVCSVETNAIIIMIVIIVEHWLISLLVFHETVWRSLPWTLSEIVMQISLCKFVTMRITCIHASNTRFSPYCYYYSAPFLIRV